MGIISENATSQIEDGSPAQICADAPDLATVIFGSNFEAYAWASYFMCLAEKSAGIIECSGFKSCPAACCETHTHTHTHTHTSQ